MGIVVGDIEYFQKACPKYKFFCFPFLIIATTIVAASVMFVLKKIYLRIHYDSVYNEYLDEKEIDIIKCMIDNIGKEKRQEDIDMLITVLKKGSI